MSADRHEKWQPVEPGHVIPKGQPYAVEYALPAFGVRLAEHITRSEFVHLGKNVEVGKTGKWFVDSSWRPPQCGEQHRTNSTVIPCQLEPGHEGDHYSTSGCAGGGFSWSPLELPTEPTWGLILTVNQNYERPHCWSPKANEPDTFVTEDIRVWAHRQHIRDFIPLTAEQAARIEGAR